MSVTWSDEKLILLYCPGLGSNSRPSAHRSVNMINMSHALTTRPLTWSNLNENPTADPNVSWNDRLNITLNELNLQQVSQQKVIGVVVDENLKWREHVNGVYKKISQTLALFRRIKQFLPQWSRILFYNSYIMPHLDYCVTVWGDCSDVARLEKLQKQAARIILDCHYLTPSKDMFSQLRWLPLKDWVTYRKATMTYKAINGKAPDYISAMFRYVSDVHKRTTRQTCNKDLYIPSKARLNVFRNTLRYSGAHIWNNLPAKVKNVSSVKMFKTSYLNMYFS